MARDTISSHTPRFGGVLVSGFTNVRLGSEADESLMLCGNWLLAAVFSDFVMRVHQSGYTFGST
jgi:hypothetical protein